jgi:uncharacterized membrane protein YccC
MENQIKQLIIEEVKTLFLLKKTERLWHIPLLASLCTGTPLMIGFFLNELPSGVLACIAGLVILYLPSNSSITDRMRTLLVCSIGFIISFTIGVYFSFDPIISVIVLGIFSACVHWLTLYYKINPPGNFFFIMIAILASCMPYAPQTILLKIGLVAVGTLFACILALLYCLFVRKKNKSVDKTVSTKITKNNYANFIEALIFGTFISGSLFVGHQLKMQNPYWIPISCLAVMQGASLHNIWRRTFHRILGTLIGLGLCWIILSINKTSLSICISIIFLQFIVEMLIVRHYTLAVIFITPMTILIAETANPIFHNTDTLIFVRFWDILIGSAIGAIGGWFIYHEKIRYHSIRRIEKITKIIKRKQ